MGNDLAMQELRMHNLTLVPRITPWLLALLLAGSALPAQADLFGRAPRVASVSTEEVQALMAAGTESKDVVLVDVRSPEEIAVSIIPGAISVSEFEANFQQYRAAEVITYCTVGVRSAYYADKLIDAGVRARNYEGSILDWVGAGLPVVTSAGEATRRVHVYSRRYSVPPPYKAVTGMK